MLMNVQFDAIYTTSLCVFLQAFHGQLQVLTGTGDRLFSSVCKLICWLYLVLNSTYTTLNVRDKLKSSLPVRIRQLIRAILIRQCHNGFYFTSPLDQIVKLGTDSNAL